MKRAEPGAAVGQASAASATSVPEALSGGESLRAIAERQHRYVGVALATWFFQQAHYQEVASAQFNSLTPENEMKWNVVERTPGDFNFSAGDKLLAFAEQHHMRVRGHTLIWHNQLGQGVKELSGEALRAAMLRHVTTTVAHWKGRIAQWDVVNEALDEDGTLRKNSPFTALGKGYIADAFRAAHAADPNAQLFYNDYEAEGLGDAKSEAMYQLVKELKESGVPIHGAGFQMHVEPRHWPTAESVHKNLERFAALGLVVELTEIDVPVGEIAGTPEQKLEEQRRLAHDLIAACWGLPACSGVTLWGLTDRQSWLSSAEWGKLRGRGPHLPLPFDADYQPKPMFEGVASALRGE